MNYELLEQFHRQQLPPQGPNTDWLGDMQLISSFLFVGFDFEVRRAWDYINASTHSFSRFPTGCLLKNAKNLNAFLGWNNPDATATRDPGIDVYLGIG